MGTNSHTNRVANEETIMKTIQEQMELARKAQAAINDYTQEQVDDMCLAAGWEV